LEVEQIPQQVHETAPEALEVLELLTIIEVTQELEENAAVELMREIAT
jgi:hypothetical protein